MTTEELYQRLARLLDRSDEADKKHIKKLRQVLRELKKRQKELTAKLEDTHGSHEQRKLQQDIEVLKLQRKKGVVVYKDLKRARAEEKKAKEKD